MAEGVAPGDARAVEQALLQEVHDAEAVWKAANAYFKSLVQEVPSGIPAPDGAYRIQLAGAAFREAQRRYTEALRRFAEFVTGEYRPLGRK